jgi:hypothetical protein
VAAPVFARVAETALRRLAIPPDDPDRVLRLVPFQPKATQVSYRPAAAAPAAPRAMDAGDPQLMPDLRGSSAREAAIAAARRGLVVDLKGSGRGGPTARARHGVEPGSSCVLTLSARDAA